MQVSPAGGVLGGRYRLVEVVGSGGMATVWRGWDDRVKRAVAVKVLNDLSGLPNAYERFEREIEVAGNLGHPNIVTVYDCGQEAPDRTGRETAYVVMELVRGRSMADMVADPVPVPVLKAVGWAVQLAEALRAAHAGDVIHRDVKPANAVVTWEGRVKVLDFGIAKFLRTLDPRAAITQPGSVIGTLAYMAPEQLEGAVVSARTDLYSLGCLLYELLTGAPPFGTDEPGRLVHAHLRQAPVPPSVRRPGLPAGLDALVLDLLAKDPAGRPPDAKTVSERLCELLPPGLSAEEALTPPPPPMPPRAPLRVALPPQVPRPTRLLGGPDTPDSFGLWGPDSEESTGSRGGADLTEIFSGPRQENHAPVRRQPGDTRDLYARLDAVLARPAPEAGRLLRDLLVDYLTLFGPDHRHVLRLREEIAHQLGTGGSPQGAVRWIRALVSHLGRVRGSGNSAVLRCRRNLAYWTAVGGDPGAAARMLGDLLPDLPGGGDQAGRHRLAVRREQAAYARQAGDNRSAAELFTALLTDSRRMFGPDHPFTEAIRGELSYKR